MQPLVEPLAQQHGVELFVARIDTLHPVVSGNKLFKLVPNIDAARKSGYNTLLSFGGFWSNHIHALAYAGKACDMATVGVIRGHPGQRLSATLEDARRWGMTLRFVGREDYRRRHDAAWVQAMASEYDKACVLPEGGSNALAVSACTGINSLLGDNSFDTAVVALGTGATAAGLLRGSPAFGRVLAVSSLKGPGDSRQRLIDFAGPQARTPFELLTDYHFGGYGRVNRQLVDFMLAFYQRHQLVLDPVYTAKAFFGAYQYLAAGKFKAGEKVLLLHTGGLQGLRGFTDKWPELRPLAAVCNSDSVNSLQTGTAVNNLCHTVGQG